MRATVGTNDLRNVRSWQQETKGETKRSKPISIASKGRNRSQRTLEDDIHAAEEETQELKRSMGSMREVEVKAAADPVAVDAPLDLKIKEARKQVCSMKR